MKNFKTLTIYIFLLVAITIYLTGCAPSRSGQVYSRDHAMQAQEVENGTVESVKQVTLEGTKSGAGTVTGAVAGGALGSTIGSHEGQVVATVLGALVGAAAGTAAEDGLTKKAALEIVVNKDSGGTIVVVQEADVMIAAGDRVRIITASDGTTRISK